MVARLSPRNEAERVQDLRWKISAGADVREIGEVKGGGAGKKTSISQRLEYFL